MRLLDRFRQWMVGRYGSDQLNMTLLVVYLIFSIITSATGWFLTLLLSYASILMIFYRMFSKNISKRYAENQKFLQLVAPITKRIGKGRTGYQGNPYQNNPYQTNRTEKRRKPKTDKDHKIFQCGKCGQMIRVPKGKGKIAIKCPRCGQEFVKRT
ncbi:MAG: hypothetical protein Q4G58_03830 [bacterium]|nr:hypothetical protein [bacterium]